MTTFNIVRKANSAVLTSFASEKEALQYLRELGPQRNFLKIQEVDVVPEEKVVETVPENTGFDIQAALKAAFETSKTTRNGAQSQRLNILTQIIESADGGLSMPQIKAAYFAGSGVEQTKYEVKMVYEAVFQHSDACHNKNKPSKVLFTRDDDGIYHRTAQ